MSWINTLLLSFDLAPTVFLVLCSAGAAYALLRRPVRVARETRKMQKDIRGRIERALHRAENLGRVVDADECWTVCADGILRRLGDDPAKWTKEEKKILVNSKREEFFPGSPEW